MRDTTREICFTQGQKGGSRKIQRGRWRKMKEARAEQREWKEAGYGERNLQAYYVQGEWQVSYFATLVTVCVMQRQSCGCKQNCIKSIWTSASGWVREGVCVCVENVRITNWSALSWRRSLGDPPLTASTDPIKSPLHKHFSQILKKILKKTPIIY